MIHAETSTGRKIHINMYVSEPSEIDIQRASYFRFKVIKIRNNHDDPKHRDVILENGESYSGWQLHYPRTTL